MSTPIDVRDTLSFPPALVYEAYRENLAELVTYLPNIDAIVVEKREEADGVIRMLNLWKASRSEVPTVARSFVKPEMLRWHDHAEWRLSKMECHWRTELHFLREAIDCSGVNTFREVNGGHTELRLSGNIAVDASKVPGVPRLLANKVSAGVEAFVLKLMVPNLKAINRGLEQYLKSKQG